MFTYFIILIRLIQRISVRRLMPRLTLVVIISQFVMACETAGPKEYTSEIYLVRHFQKQAYTENQDVELTNLGKENAARLAQHLQSKNIETIYSTDYRRTIQSAQPSSAAFNVQISIYDPSALETIAAQLLESKHNQLVVGHSNTTGTLFALLGCEAVSLSESDYGDVFIVTRLHSEAGESLHSCSHYQLDDGTSGLTGKGPNTGNKANKTNHHNYDVSKLTFVKQNDLGRYWQQTSTILKFNALAPPEPRAEIANASSKEFTSGNENNKVVEVGFIIHKNGKTSGFEVVRSSPPHLWDDTAIKAAKQLQFASKQNAPTDIYTTWVFSFLPE